MSDNSGTEKMDTKVGSPEFVPTPERISQYLEQNSAEVETKLRSVSGREKLYEDLAEHENELKEIYPGFDLPALREQLDLVGETLEEKQRFLESAKTPERKNMLQRAFDRVKTFAKKHPIVTTLLVVALAAGAIAGGFYLTGNLELLTTKLGSMKWFAGADAGKILAPGTAGTEILPGGGMGAIPAPTSPAGMGFSG